MYAVVTDRSNNTLGEYIVAAVEKGAEITGISTPAATLMTQTAIALSTNSTGQTVNPITVIGHSRGTMTESDTMNNLAQQDFSNPNMTVIANNPAAYQPGLANNVAKV